MRQIRYDVTDPQDHEIARRLKNAIWQFKPPASQRRWILFLAGLLRLPPILNPVACYEYSTYLEPALVQAVPNHPWNDALSANPGIGMAIGFI